MSKSVVITGATRGIGLGMAGEFLKRGHRVTICGRSAESTEAARSSLAEQYGEEFVHGLACDVGKIEDVEALWRAAKERFSTVDMWINNAGIGSEGDHVAKLDGALIDAVIRTNLRGVFHGSKVAMKGMLEQGHGHIFNMEGLGSDGNLAIAGSALYGSTKAGLTYMTKVLVKEAKGSAVKVGFLSPGMVITDLFLRSQGERIDEDFKRFANILADKVETVVPYLVTRMLASRKHGAKINWLTGRKVFFRFLTAPFRRRDLFAK